MCVGYRSRGVVTAAITQRFSSFWNLSLEEGGGGGGFLDDDDGEFGGQIMIRKQRKDIGVETEQVVVRELWMAWLISSILRDVPQLAAGHHEYVDDTLCLCKWKISFCQCNKIRRNYIWSGTISSRHWFESQSNPRHRIKNCFIWIQFAIWLLSLFFFFFSPSSSSSSSSGSLLLSFFLSFRN